MKYFRKVHSLLEKRQRNLFLWLLILSVFISIIETAGISAIMPFIDIVINFEKIQNNQYYRLFYDFLNFEQEVDFAISFGLLLFLFYLFRGGVNLFFNYMLAWFSQDVYMQITGKLFKAYMNMPFQAFSEKNSSYLTKTIVIESSLLSNVLSSILLIVSETFIIIFLYGLMLFANWKITLIFSVVLIIKVLLLTNTVSKKIKKVGSIRSSSQAKFYEILNQLFGNFKQTKLQDETRLEQTYTNFNGAASIYANANKMNSFLGSTPRIFTETVGFSIIILLLVYILNNNQSNVSYILPTLSLFILGLYRLLPSINRIITAYNAILFNHKSIEIIDESLQFPRERLGSENLVFCQDIKLLNLEFSYQKESVLQNVNLTINKGDKIAIIGKSGSGKSTLVDLITGLYKPCKGLIKIDNKVLDQSNIQSWRAQIGYIPQQIYLFDGTIAENVCFGRELDVDELEVTLKQAYLYDFLQEKQGINTLVGEGGIQLSGGQKQRVAIARALYGKPETLILDEATSALDAITESKIMDAIYESCENKTLIIVAHRLSTVERCDKIYQIKDNMVKQC